MKFSPLSLLLAALVLPALPLAAQVLPELNYQGRVAVNGNAFTGTGQFRFALVADNGSVVWSSHATDTTGITVQNGLYSVRLGNTSLPNMAAVPSALFTEPGLRLRVWFNDGVNGLQQLAPDQFVTPVAYAHRASSAASADSIPASAIDGGSIQPSHLADGVQTGFMNGFSTVPPEGGVLNITFPTPFGEPPVVTLGHVTVPPANVTTTGFTITYPPRKLIVDDGTPAANDVGLHRDVMLVQGNPAICYTDSTSGDLKYVRATNAQGSAWGPPVIAAAGGSALVGAYCSMTLISGNVPAIAYYDQTNKDLKFVRALDVNGTSWAAPVAVASHITDDLGKGCILKSVVIGVGNVRPFILFLDATAGTMKVAKANSSDGATWSIATPVPTLTGLTDPTAFDLQLVSGPELVIPYFDPAIRQLRVVESANLNSNTWNVPRTITDTEDTYTGLDAYLDGLDSSLELSWVRQSTLYVSHIPGTVAGFDLVLPMAIGTEQSVDFFRSRMVPGARDAVIFGNMRYVEEATGFDLTWGEPGETNLGSLSLSDAAPSAVRLADESVLVVYYSQDGGGQMLVCGALGIDRYWRAELPSPLLAAGVVDGSIGRAALEEDFFGDGARATGGSAFATGILTNALGPASWASGFRSVASGSHSTAMGSLTTASGDQSTTMGEQTEASGSASTASGYHTAASGIASTAMGYRTIASGSSATAMGSYTTASGPISTAMGSSTTASGYNSTAMGEFTTASGPTSLATGELTTASGSWSTATGYDSIASGRVSTAIGRSSRAETWGEISLGFYPVANTGDPDNRISTDVLMEVGNGTTSTTSNALTIFKSGLTGLGTADTTAEVTHRLTLPNSAISTEGQARANAWTTYSDSRIKTEQRPISYGLADIMRLQPRAYTQHSGCVENGTFKCEDEKGGSAETIGFIAQEVEKVIPEAVQKPADPANQLYGMDYEKLIPVLVKATQELKAENDALKTALKTEQEANQAALRILQQRLDRLERPAKKR